MQGSTSSTAAATAVPAMEEEERYVKVASRFYRVKPRGGGGDTMARPHYLDSCFLCKRSIACDRDIFMYRGDAAFCSDECRQEQMDMDEALHAVARRHRLLRTPSSSSAATGDARPTMMRRRPTIANLAARNPPVVAS